MAASIYRLSRRARMDLEQISDYIGQRNSAASDRVIDELLRAFESLATSPELGVSLGNLRPQLRMLIPQKPAARYLIFYQIVPDGVMISAVIHSARDWVGMLGRGEL